MASGSVSPDQPSQGDRPAGCLSPADCRPGPIPSREKNGVACSTPYLWIDLRGSTGFPLPLAWPARRLAPACLQMAQHLPSDHPLGPSRVCLFRGSHNEGPLGASRPTEASASDWLLLGTWSRAVADEEGSKLVPQCSVSSLGHTWRPCHTRAGWGPPPRVTDSRRLPQALTWTRATTLRPWAHEAPPQHPPDPRVPPLLKGSAFQLCSASLAPASVSLSVKWGKKQRLPTGQD